ncbi:MAG: AraC family transcriptional regulator [Flavipsychrobacter sp.]
MQCQLKHPVCVLTISDTISNMLQKNEYRNQYFSIILLDCQNTSLTINDREHIVNGNTLFFIAPFQPLHFTDKVPQNATVIQFNADLFCIEKHDSEIGCNGILFNSIFDPPMLSICTEALSYFNNKIQQMCAEIEDTTIGSVDMLESHIKQFLVHAVRIKKSLSNHEISNAQSIEQDKIIELRQLINTHYKEERKLKFYADKLYLSESGLHKLISKHTGKTFTELLYDKIIISAKKQLFTTNNSVKEISYDLGFNDPAYFNRFFKKQCTITPENYRKVIRNSAA